MDIRCPEPGDTDYSISYPQTLVQLSQYPKPAPPPSHPTTPYNPSPPAPVSTLPTEPAFDKRKATATAKTI